MVQASLQWPHHLTSEHYPAVGEKAVNSLYWGQGFTGDTNRIGSWAVSVVEADGMPVCEVVQIGDLMQLRVEERGR